ncbi:MAG: hypothetical protein HOK21_05640 [Rhodospirillaceae bacterium]|jgi:hypothetical protein|nr:hypothetical protein [Rhodospirillaceae bacterium]MBT3768112.1 hypothetical protein [Rhodospirillales bacterium]MBT5082074.1 hypothetical protein [Rhodospirillaceae bacterium]MBT5523547.1 hypothetical protein [Rhodospirillaceae bacterium]MBT5878990.1 hypothetical protein [Rhodospirillaceae bacterium]
MKTIKTMMRVRYAIPLLAGLCAAFATMGPAFATAITVDGIMTAGEYTGANSGSREIVWYNDHNSIYTLAAGHMNPLSWEINGSGADFSLNLFFEVPDYARRMIWADGCTYSGGTPDSACSDIPIEYLDAYLAGSHHFDDKEKTVKSVKMDYGTQTGSEYFMLNVTGPNSPVFDKKWQYEDSDGTADGLTWATSREYLIDQGICTVDKCLEFNRTASVELMFLGLASSDEAKAVVDSVVNMQLHLSDEAVGLPPVPIPAALPLFASGLAVLGFAGWRRKKAAA